MHPIGKNRPVDTREQPTDIGAGNIGEPVIVVAGQKMAPEQPLSDVAWYRVSRNAPACLCQQWRIAGDK
jgi:hypothetical protein